MEFSRSRREGGSLCRNGAVRFRMKRRRGTAGRRRCGTGRRQRPAAGARALGGRGGWGGRGPVRGAARVGAAVGGGGDVALFRFGGADLKAADDVVHPLAGLEGDDLRLGHHHLLAGAGVAGLAGLALAHLEDAEVAQFQPPLACERVDDVIKGALDDLLDVGLAHVGLAGDLKDDIVLGHSAFVPPAFWRAFLLFGPDARPLTEQ